MRGLLMLGLGVGLIGVFLWLLIWTFSGTLHIVGGGRYGVGYGIGGMVIGMVFGLCCTVDGGLRLARFGAERLSWERVMRGADNEDRLVAELLEDVVADARRKPGDESRGELRLIARRHLKKAGIRGPKLVEYLAHRLATEADARLV